MRRYLQFIADYWPLLAFGFVTVFWGNFGQSFFISWFGAAMQSSLGITATTYGSIYSAATLCSGLSVMVVGGAIDKWPLRWFMSGVALGLTVAALVLWRAEHVAFLFVGFFLLRLCGQALLPHSAQTTMARQFAADRGKALSISSSGVPLGEVILPLIAVGLIASVGWRNSWLVVALSVPLLYLPLAFGLLRLAQRRGHYVPFVREDKPHTQKHSAGRREMLRDARFWRALPALMCGPFVITGVFIQQSFILAEKAWSPTWFASTFIVYGIVHWLSSLGAGLLVDRFTAQRVLPFAVMPLALGLLFAANLDGAWVALVMMALLGMTVGAVAPVTGALWAEVYGTAKLGSIRSLVTSIMVLTTAVAPVALGALIDLGQSAQQVLNLLGALVALAVVLVFFSYRPEQQRPAA